MVEARILIADDSKMNQQILSEILGVRYEYLYADDGMQALELLHSEFDIDLLLLDIKEIDPQRHKDITGFSNENILDMARYLSDIGKPVWIRHVLVPGLSDFDEDLDKLSEFISTLKNVQKVEVLPYHTLGKFKWENLGIKYSLEDTAPPTPERIDNAQRRLGAGKYACQGK